MLARRLPACLLLCAAMLLGGCAAVTVSDVSPAEYLQQRRGDVLTTGKLSAASSEVLRIIGSDIAACTGNAGSCRADLARSTLLSDEQRLATLSELWLGSDASAHLDGAQSEQVFPSWHSVQEHPQAILEIRRILRLAD